MARDNSPASSTSQQSAGASASPPSKQQQQQQQQQKQQRRKTGRACKARSLACRACRDRKIRCDGARPVCDACSRRGLSADQCVYPEIEYEGSIASSRSYILALQKRVRELEDKEQQMTSVLQARRGSDVDSQMHPESHQRPLSPRQSTPSRPVLPSICSEPTLQLSTFPSGIGALPMPHEAPLGAYHGPSHHHQAAAATTHSPPLTDDMDEGCSTHSSSHSPVRSVFGSYSTNPQAARMLEKISLPPSALIEELLGVYFDWDWPMAPLVHQPTFMQRCQHLVVTSNSRYRRDIPLAETTQLAATYCLLLGMLAIGQLSRSPADDAQDAIAGASSLHHQARALLLADLSLVPSLGVVQALVLHVRFLERIGAVPESLMLAGMAQRMAEGLRLHVDVAPGLSQCEREEQKRTWCACVQLLRTNSPRSESWPALGSLPAEVDDEHLETRARVGDAMQPPESPSRIAFFAQGFRLSEVASRHAKESSNSRTEDDVFGMLSEVLRIDDEIQQWHGKLPGHLRLADKRSQATMLSRCQATVLHMRYTETKATVYRDAIVQLVKHHSQKPLAPLCKSLVAAIIDGFCTAAQDAMAIIASERALLSRTGSSQSQLVSSLCVAGMALSLLSKAPLLQGLAPPALASDILRCLALAKQLHTRHDASAEALIGAFDEAVQGRARAVLSPVSDVVDPALEGEGLPSISGIKQAAGLNGLDGLDERGGGRMELAMLEASCGWRSC